MLCSIPILGHCRYSRWTLPPGDFSSHISGRKPGPLSVRKKGPRQNTTRTRETLWRPSARPGSSSRLPSLGGRRCSLGESGIPTGARNPRGVLKTEATSKEGGCGVCLQTNTGTWLPTLKSPEVPKPWWDGFVYPAFSQVPVAAGSRPCVPPSQGRRRARPTTQTARPISNRRARRSSLRGPGRARDA